MTSKANFTNFNTNIDDYSIEELYNLLELEEFTKEQIIINVNYLTTNVFNNNETIKYFFFNIQDKLLHFLAVNNNSFDNMLHSNANSNIETNNDDISETNEENNISENNSKEGFTGLNPITNDTIQPLSNFVVKNVLRKKKFYFDTTQKLYANEEPTNCKMYVQRIINVIKAKLISLTCKVPLLIHSSKLNNFFNIQKFVGTVCDFSAQIIIDDGYYEESVKMAETININIQKKATDLINQDSSGSEFLKDLAFSFNYLNKSVFELSYNLVKYNMTSYTIDFTSTANDYYALSNILGFTSIIINSDIINGNTRPLTLTSPKPYNTISNKLPFFFCFEDNNNSIISNYICQKTNVIQSRVLARIAPLTCPQTSNVLSTKFNEFNSNVLLYNGRVNVENFTVKIIDIYGNILLAIDDDYCFEIEFECEELTSTNNSSIIIPNIL